MTANVKNHFEQADSAGDNPLILSGTVEDANNESMKKEALTVRMNDISDSDSDGTAFVVSPFSGTISQYSSVIDGPISTSDSTIDMEINGTPVTDGSIIITQSGSAAGDADSANPTADNVVVPGDVISLLSDNASSNQVAAVFTIEIERS